MFGQITNFFRNLLRSSPALQVRTSIHIETEAEPMRLPGHAMAANLGLIRLDDGTMIEVPDYDHDAVRDQYFAELARPAVTDDDIMVWLNGVGQAVDPDHLPYDPKTGF